MSSLSNLSEPTNTDREIILVDNASTDGTAAAAREQWPNRIPLRVVHEPQLGLRFARRRGIEAAAHEVVSFVDDDNWVGPQWVQRAAAVMAQHPEVGACGGPALPAFEAPPPPWFETFSHSYAVGAQSPQAGDITETRGWLWGAGLTVRKRAWDDLLARGFRPRLHGRRGAALTAGDDSEICYALRLAGWRLWYDPALTLTHYMPKERLTWDYLRRLHRGFGAASLALGLYRYALRGRTYASLRGRWLMPPWLRAAVSATQAVLRGRRAIGAEGPREGSAAQLQLEADRGRLTEVLRWRTGYDAFARELLGRPAWVRAV